MIVFLLSFFLSLGFVLFIIYQQFQYRKISRKLSKAKDKHRETSISALRTLKHELKTPLSIIKGHLEILMEETKIKSGKLSSNSLITMYRNCQYIEDILTSLSFFEETCESAKKSKVNVRDFFSKILQLVDSKNENKINLEIKDHVPDSLLFAEIDLKLIVLNLINNANKFTNRGTISVSVDFQSPSTSSVNHFLKIKISDNGPGIEKKNLEKIFEPFFQCESGMSRTYGGMGLGLSICKSLVHRMKGIISVHSNYGEGSTFEVKLPMDKSEIFALNSNSEIVTINTDSCLAQNKSHKILVVDDSDDIMHLYHLYLGGAAFSVIYAKNGKEACDAVKQAEASGAPVDLLFLDLQMPILNGYQAARLLRQQGYKMPIIAVTAHEYSSNESVKEKYGLTEIVEKPFNKNILFNRIDKYVHAKDELLSFTN